MQDEKKYFKVVSLLLQYPDEAFFRALPEVKSVVIEICQGRCRAAIEAFIAGLEAGDCLQVQERYTALFDMSPSTSLDMTYHLYGDGEKRARLLARLQQDFASAGLEKKSTELPDFLPLILEFLATVPQARWSDTILKSLEGIDTLVERLKPVAANYAGLLIPLAGIFKEQAEEWTAAGVK